jgi:hypothetical protein
LTHFKVGMINAPFGALVIGVVAVAKGLKTKGRAETFEQQTTTSIVKSKLLDPKGPIVASHGEARKVLQGSGSWHGPIAPNGGNSLNC